MSQQKSFAIGAFIVGAILLVFVALLFFSGGNLFSQKERIVMYFEESVQGLQIGAPIKLKGVVLGEITDIQINFPDEDEGKNPVIGSEKNTIATRVTADLALQRISRTGTTVDRSFFEDAISKGLRAQLNYQSFLTGLLYVELNFFPDTEPKLYKLQDDYLEIPTAPTAFEEISKNLQEINIKGLIDNLDKLTTSVNKLVQTGVIEQTLSSVKTAADSFTQVSGTINNEVVTLSKNLTATNQELKTLLLTLNKETPLLAANMNSSLVELQKSLDQFSKAAGGINQSFSEDSPLIVQLTETLEDVSRSAKAFRSLSETLEQQPEALLRGKKIADEEP
ncbi:MlaD family protein [Cellvibrio fontiphilus]|uniref:MlaD family protein n=1 Tax=Cellvibrio fontiphilus TaxID=1815559 RepID=A0ABV7FIT1_9GAMM